MNRRTSSAETVVPVGLFGLQTKTMRVRSVILSAMASRSCRQSDAEVVTRAFWIQKDARCSLARGFQGERRRAEVVLVRGELDHMVEAKLALNLLDRFTRPVGNKAGNVGADERRGTGSQCHTLLR